MHARGSGRERDVRDRTAIDEMANRVTAEIDDRSVARESGTTSYGIAST
jgi:hypothetical protein